MAGPNGDDSRIAYELEAEVTRDRAEPGRTVSKEALEGLSAELQLWIVERIADAWVTRGRPPVALALSVKLVVTLAPEP